MEMDAVNDSPPEVSIQDLIAAFVDEVGDDGQSG